jgi:N-acetylglucosamine kinase-like BadF-type ATPase
MILIADSGSTKTTWCVLDKNSKFLFHTEGYNPFLVKADYIIDSLNKNLPADINRASIDRIYFYGSGCIGDKVSIIQDALSTVFINAKVQVESDLVAAARALLKGNKGFAAILGTGTNSCLYDGKSIIHNISSLGYILGDEGSGSYIGKKLLIDFMRGKLPLVLEESFRKTYSLTQNEILDRIYRQPLPNRFCAGFTKFLKENN